MKSKLHAKLYHFIWKILRKKRLKVEGFDITYATLPYWLLLGGPESKEFFSGAMLITHRPTDTLMIFVSKEKRNPKKLRYTLYHEYLEGSYILGKFSQDQKTRLDYNAKFTGAIVSLKNDWPEIEEKIGEYVKRPWNRGHALALILELALAKKEMNREDFLKFLDDAKKNRL